jgi:hypothetical protein
LMPAMRVMCLIVLGAAAALAVPLQAAHWT